MGFNENLGLFEVPNRHRYFCSKSGSFVSEDYLGQLAGENLYQFGPNSLQWIDPFGLACKGLGKYKDVAGHHIHAKSAFKGHTAYDLREAFCISQAEMKKRGWSHKAMTAKQRELFDKLAQSGKPNTLVAHSRIARESLVAGGATPAEARQLVRESLKDLKLQKVTSPVRIPWN